MTVPHLAAPIFGLGRAMKRPDSYFSVLGSGFARRPMRTLPSGGAEKRSSRPPPPFVGTLRGVGPLVLFGGGDSSTGSGACLRRGTAALPTSALPPPTGVLSRGAPGAIMASSSGEGAGRGGGVGFAAAVGLGFGARRLGLGGDVGLGAAALGCGAGVGFCLLGAMRLGLGGGFQPLSSPKRSRSVGSPMSFWAFS